MVYSNRFLNVMAGLLAMVMVSSAFQVPSPIPQGSSTIQHTTNRDNFKGPTPTSLLFQPKDEVAAVAVTIKGKSKKMLKKPTSVQKAASVSLDFPSRRGFPEAVLDVIAAPPKSHNNRRFVKTPTTKKREKSIIKEEESTKVVTKTAISKLDVCLFATYFCNIATVTLPVVTLPALAAEYFTTSPQAVAAFVAGIASIAPLGGGLGKVINGFVCQHLGGRRSSWIYLLGLSSLSFGLSATKSTALIGLLMFGYEFLASIQWTSVCSVLDDHFQTEPHLKARGIAILGISSTLGALFAKVVGSALLQASNWRVVSQFGGLLSLTGALAMYAGVSRKKTLIRDLQETSHNVAEAEEARGKESGLTSMKKILSSPFFWQIGLANSLGFMARNSDRLLGPFLSEVSALPGSVCAGLTSSITLGFVYGLVKSKRFGKLKSVAEKVKMLKGNYRLAVFCMLGLATCGLNSMKLVTSKYSGVIAGIITALSGLMASTVAMQFYNFPNLLSSALFPKSSAISLSLTDAVGFFATSQMFAMNSWVVGRFGWSASWTFLAVIFGIGGKVMLNAIPTVLREAEKKQAQ